MPDPAAWQSFAGVVGVLIFLGSGAFALKRLGILGSRPAAAAQASTPPPPADEKLRGRMDVAERAIADVRLCIAENYVRRDDYIMNESRVIGLLENHSVMLARLEERIGARS